VNGRQRHHSAVAWTGGLPMGSADDLETAGDLRRLGRSEGPTPVRLGASGAIRFSLARLILTIARRSAAYRRGHLEKLARSIRAMRQRLLGSVIVKPPDQDGPIEKRGHRKRYGCREGQFKSKLPRFGKRPHVRRTTKEHNRSAPRKVTPQESSGCRRHGHRAGNAHGSPDQAGK